MVQLLCALFIALLPFSFVLADEEISLEDMNRIEQRTIDKLESLREKIAFLNRASIMPEERNWSSWTTYEYLTKSIRAQVDQLPQNRREIAFKMIFSTPYATTSIVHEPTTWQDLTLFSGKRAGDNYVGKVLDRTKTEIGKAQFFSLLAASTTDAEEITTRQNIIKALLADKTLRNQLQTLFNNYAACENILMSHWQMDHYIQGITKQYFFTDPIFKNINHSSFAVWCKYGLEVLSQANSLLSSADSLRALVLYLFSVIIDLSTPYTQQLAAQAKQRHNGDLMARYAWNHGPDFVKYSLTCMSIYFLYNAIENQVNNVVDNLMFEEIIHFKLTQAAQVLSILENIATLLKSRPALLELLPPLQAIKKLFSTAREENGPLYDLLVLLKSDTFAPGSKGLFANRGKVMLAYTGLHTLKDHLLPSLQALSLLDAYTGIATLMEEKEQTFCFAELERATAPHISLQNFINPLVPADKAVTNSLSLGAGEASRNCLITGPNAGGKSTLIKGIGINVLLAQSLGIAAAKRCILTPFSLVATYLNITDDINIGNSLFKAEVLRTQELIERLFALPSGKHGLLIFDEVFNGTTPKEGSAAAYAVGEFLGKCLNGITVIATHFEQLTHLQDVADNGYKNYKVSVSINADGSLSYPFKLEEGVSDQHIALDILRNEGYAGAILTRTAHLLGKA